MKSETGDPIGDLLLKLIIAAVAIILFISIFPVSLSTIGLVSCSMCDSLTAAVVLGVLPLALVFIAIYFIWRPFHGK